MKEFWLYNRKGVMVSTIILAWVGVPKDQSVVDKSMQLHLFLLPLFILCDPIVSEKRYEVNSYRAPKIKAKSVHL